MKPRKCADDNPKTVLRRYDWDGKIVKISICNQHKLDPDFAGFVSEIPILEEVIQ